MAGKSKVVSEEYKSALADLTFNSKPMINVLTMLAEENSDYAQNIVQVVCERIKKVAIDQKMPALYLLDSILKNIGGEYVTILSKHIAEVFCHVFESANDERKRMQLFKLRNTWTQYLPNKTLYELDVRISRTDPNWPVSAPVVTTPIVLSTVTTPTVQLQNVIHVNPKFLPKKSEHPATTAISASLAASIAAEKADLEASKLQSKINKQRLLDEEKRVQEQLKLLQADKRKRDQHQHELVLRQQQLERERLLAEQKRQLEVLRKQQQNMVQQSNKKNTSRNQKLQSPPGSSVQSSSSAQLPQKEQIKDPRIRNNSASKDPRVIKSSEKLSSPTEKSKPFKPYSKSPIPQPKSTNKSAVNVVNKIMTSLNTKKSKPASKGKTIGKTNEQTLVSVSSTASRNVEIKDTVSASPKSTHLDKLSGIMGSITHTFSSSDATTTTSTSSTCTVVASTKETTVVSSQPLTSHATLLSNTSVATSFAGAFSHLSNRDMQIAAQAAAIATAMHQMQSNVSSTMGPEQSAQLAAQLIQLVQGTVNSTTSVMQPSAAPVQTIASVPAVSTTVAESSRCEQQNVEKSEEVKPANEKIPERTGNVSQKPSHELNRKNENRDEFGRDIVHDQGRDRSPHRNSQNVNRWPRPQSADRCLHIEEQRQRGIAIDKDYRSRERIRDNDHAILNKDEPPSKKSRGDSQLDISERSGKARARSPSRYYNRMERKIKSEKRIEKNEKELLLQRIRKNSDGELTVLRKKSDSDSIKEDNMDDLDDIDLPEVDDMSDLTKIDLPDANMPSLQDKKVSRAIGNKPETMSQDEWYQVRKDRRKEFKSLKAKLLEITQQKENEKLPADMPSLREFKDQVMFKYQEGLVSKEQNEQLISQINQMMENKSKERIQSDKVQINQPIETNEHLHWRARRDLQNNVPFRGRASPTQQFHGQGYINQLPFRTDGSGPRFHSGPERDMGFHSHPLWDEPRRIFDDDEPYVRDVREHMRDGPLPGPPPHLRDDPPPHMRDGLPLHMRDGPPSHMRDRPPPRMREGPPPCMREGPPPHVREGPPPHMREGPPPHMRDGPPPHMRDGPQLRDIPVHMRDGPPPPHMSDGLLHIRDPLPPRIRDGHMRESTPPLIRDGPHDRPIPPHFQERVPPIHMRDCQFNDRPYNDAPPPFYRASPPHKIQPNVLEGNHPFVDGYLEQAGKKPNVDVHQSINVNNLFDKLLAAGMLNQNAEAELDLDVPEIPLQIEDLRRRHQSIVNHLFQGMQCSSCGQRFPTEYKKQYSEHLDWHFRQNRKEKDGVKKSSSRSWYYDVHDWFENCEQNLQENGKVQSTFFEAEFSNKEDMEESSAPKKVAHSNKNDDDHTALVKSTDGGVCKVCLESLEQYWDEDHEEWRYKNAIRDNNELYHFHCFKDYVPFELEEVAASTSLDSTSPTVVSATTEFKLDVKQEEADTPTVAEESIVKETSVEVSVPENDAGAGCPVETKVEIKDESDILDTIENIDSPEYPVIPDVNVTTALAEQLSKSLLPDVKTTSVDETNQSMDNVEMCEKDNHFNVKVQPVSEVLPELNKSENEAAVNHQIDG